MDILNNDGDLSGSVKNLFSTLSNIKRTKANDLERRGADLQKLIDISLSGIDSGDAEHLNSLKEGFVTQATNLFKERGGYLTSKDQQYLNDLKKQVAMESEYSKDWRDKGGKVLQAIHTNPNIDVESSIAGFGALMKTPDGQYIPPSQRVDPYTAISLNFDVNEYIKKNAIINPTKTEFPDPTNKNRKIEVEEVTLSQAAADIKRLYEGSKSMQHTVNKKMKEEGFTGTVDEYIATKYAPAFTKKNTGYQEYHPGKGNTVIINQGNDKPVEGDGSSVYMVKSAPGKKTVVEKYTYKPEEVYTHPPAKVNVNGSDIIYSNDVTRAYKKGFRDTPINVTIQGTEYLRSVYNQRTKKWMPIPMEDYDKYDDYSVMPYLTGTAAMTNGKSKGNVKVYIPATDERKRSVEAVLGNDAGKQPYDLEKTTSTFAVGSLSDARKTNPGVSDEMLIKLYNDQYGIKLR